MKTIGEIIRIERERKGMLLRQLASYIDIDASILSKVERGERKATKTQIIKIAEILSLNKNELLIQYISEKIAYELVDEESVKQTLKAAEKKVEYLKREKYISANK